MARVRVLVERTGHRPVAESVTTVELFFDLVFVFAITQLTATLGHEPTWRGLGHVVLLLVLMWWMYGGYAWLTNAVPPVTMSRRLFLLAGMGANFVMALTVPHAYGRDAMLFAGGYAVVIGVHAAMYLSQASRVTYGMVAQLVLGNGLAAALVLTGAALGGTGLWVCWVGALGAAIVLPRTLGSMALGPDDVTSFEVQPAHFVERHGLMLIIVLGESVLAIGVGLGSGAEGIGAVQVGFAVVSLTLAASLYWAYFGSGEDRSAELALTEGRLATDRVALNAFGYAFAVILLGVVLLASGLHHALADPLHHLDLTWGLQLGGGSGLVWLGLCAFRAATGRRDIALRTVGALACATCAVLATEVSGIAAVVAILLVCLAVLTVEAVRHVGAEDSSRFRRERLSP